MAAKRKDSKTLEYYANENLKNMVIGSKWYPVPTRKFEVGEEVIYGNHVKTTILQSYENGKFYHVSLVSIDNNYGNQVTVESEQLVYWTDLFKKNSWPSDSEKFSKVDDLFISFNNSDISSLLMICYRGMNFEPDYQRELVWGHDDKIALLDSIFNNVDIGKFSIIVINYMKTGFDFNNDFRYEILDGKQRLSTIKEFYEDRLVYRGKTYSQLDPKDRNHFDMYPIVRGEVKEPINRNDIYRYFLKLNTTGKPMPITHIEKVKNLIK